LKGKILNDKPWITLGILKSIKTKNKFYRRLFRNKNSNEIEKTFYKNYLNKLTYIKHAAKRNYKESLIKNSSNNTSQIWPVLNKTIDCKKTFQQA